MSWLATIAGSTFALLCGVLVLTINDALRARMRIRRRMRPITEILSSDEAVVTLAEAVPETRSGSDNFVVARLDGLFPLSGGVRTGMIVLGTTLLLWILLVPATVFVGVPVALAVFLSLVAAATIGWNVGSFIETRRRDAYCNRLVTAVEDFQRLVRFGTSSLRALRSVAKTAEEPLARSFRAILREADLGVPLDQAMAQEAHRVRMGELAMLSAIISAQSDAGGRISDAVGNLASMLRERLDSRMRLKATTAESKVTMIVLALVPLLAIAIQAFLQPEMVDTLLGEARHLLGAGVGLIVSGLFVSWLMIRSVQR
ncbi:MAG: type II secretion system F family protein [Gammaproteobacteria bacterium]|nr:type II secretion system F family protein [Gammaproteobacteria bacterium]